MGFQLNNKIKLGRRKELDISSRYLLQTAERAMKGDIVRGLVELITNVDDSYCVLEDDNKDVSGEMLVSIERKRKGKSTTIKVLDRAAGMTLEEMMEKLSRVSRKITTRFIETRGRGVRGMMGRGSKECVIFGKLIYKSIKDGVFSEIHIERSGNEVFFTPIKEEKANEIHRRVELDIPEGNGTLAMLEIESRFKIPTHEWLIKNLPKYYSLRDIASSSNRKLILIDIGRSKQKNNSLVYNSLEGEKLFDDKIYISTYPQAEAHFVLRKAQNRIKVDESSPYWEGGVVIKSNHAIHGISSFSRDIANNPYFEYYFGKLECPYIDILAVEYEENERKKKNQIPENPCRIIDPLRSEGIIGNHPFTKALYGEIAKQIKFFLKKDEEAEKHKTREIENEKTKGRLKKLANEVDKFIKEHTEDIEALEDENYLTPSEIPSGGMIVIPGGLKIPLNEERKIYIYSRPSSDQEEKHVLISTKSGAIQVNPSIIGLIERGDRVLTNCFSVKGLKKAEDIKIKLKWGNIIKYIPVSVISEREGQYIEEFQFEKENYSIREGKQKNIRILAIWPDFIHGRVRLKVNIDENKYCKLLNENIVLDYNPKMKEIFGSRLATGSVKIKGIKAGGPVDLYTTLQNKKISTKIRVIPKKEFGTDFEIKIVDEDLGDQRAILVGNIIKINGRHKIIQRYLGPPTDFIGQDSIYFRLLIAELIADTVARRILELNAQKNINEYRDMDVTGFYRKHRMYMNDFLEIAHRIQIPNNEIGDIIKKNQLGKEENN